MTEEFNGVGCASIEDIEISSGSSFFGLKDGDKKKIRFLQGPSLYYVSQERDDKEKKFLGEKIKYDFDDPVVKKDQHARLTAAYLVYNYKDEAIQLWEIHQKTILSAIKAINEMKADLSKFDIQVSRVSNKEYHLVQGDDKPFELKEVIDEVIEKGLIERLKKPESTIDQEEKDLQAEIEMNKAMGDDKTPEVKRTPDQELDSALEDIKPIGNSDVKDTFK